MATSPSLTEFLTVRTCSKMARGVVPRSRALCIAEAMTGPSAMGSENGMPISVIAAPACSIAPRRAGSEPGAG